MADLCGCMGNFVPKMLLFPGRNPNKVAHELMVNLLQEMLVWKTSGVIGFRIFTLVECSTLQSMKLSRTWMSDV